MSAVSQLVNLPLNPTLAAITALSLCGTSGLSVSPMGDQMLDWIEIWALTWPPQDNDLVIFQLFLRSVCCMLGDAVLLTDHSHSSLQAFLAFCWEASSDHDAATMVHVEPVCLQYSFFSLFLLFSMAVYWFFKQCYKNTYEMKCDESVFTWSIIHTTWSICTAFGVHTHWFFVFFVISTQSQNTHSKLQEWTVVSQTQFSSVSSQPCKVTPATTGDMLYSWRCFTSRQLKFYNIVVFDLRKSAFTHSQSCVTGGTSLWFKSTGDWNNTLSVLIKSGIFHLNVNSS